MRHKHYVYTLSIWQSMLQINLEKDTLLRLHSIIDFLWDCQLSRTAARNSSCPSGTTSATISTSMPPRVGNGQRTILNLNR